MGSDLSPIRSDLINGTFSLEDFSAREFRKSLRALTLMLAVLTRTRLDRGTVVKATSGVSWSESFRDRVYDQEHAPPWTAIRAIATLRLLTIGTAALAYIPYFAAVLGRGTRAWGRNRRHRARATEAGQLSRPRLQRTAARSRAAYPGRITKQGRGDARMAPDLRPSTELTRDCGTFTG
jgi:hypothetical protein